jgi:thioredoxin-like negative regulator of GroEL
MKPTITYFYSKGCPACSRIEPIVDQFGTGYEIKKINTDENDHLVEKFEIEYIPTIMIEDENGSHLFEGPYEIKKVLKQLVL